MNNIRGDTEEHGRRKLKTMERDMEGGKRHGRAYEETIKNIGGDKEENGRRKLKTMERDMEGGLRHGRASEKTMNNE